MDPGLEAVSVTQVRKLPPGGREGVLQSVLGQPAVAQDPKGDREQRIADLMHQARERVPIALAGLLDEDSVHVDLRGVTPGGAIYHYEPRGSPNVQAARGPVRPRRRPASRYRAQRLRPRASTGQRSVAPSALTMVKNS